MSKFLIRYYFKYPESYYVPFGLFEQKGRLVAAVELLPLWNKETLLAKLKAILCMKWRPSDEVMIDAADKVMRNDLFGRREDFGDVLFAINLLHHHREWNFDALTPQDDQKSEALISARLLTAQKHRLTGTNDLLKLQLASLYPQMCLLTLPMIVKIPVVSLRFTLEVQENFLFNSIRTSIHPQADELIAYLYETLLIQQKVARSFYKLLRLMGRISEKVTDSTLSMFEMDAISECDNIINYLKAGVEKMVLILGLTFEISGLETLKRHQQKLKSLDAKIPPKAKAQPYFTFIWKYIQPEELEKLNNLRTGVNHKKGVSSLQPHSYLNKDLLSSPITAQFDLLLHQHRTNTAVFLGILALLTDDLIYRKPLSDSDREFAAHLWEMAEHPEGPGGWVKQQQEANKQ